MTFLEVVKEWLAFVFKIVGDLYTKIMSYDWLAFSFWSVFILGLLGIIAYMTPTLQSIVNMVIRARKEYQRTQRQLEFDQRRAELDIRRERMDIRREQMDMERNWKKRVQANRERYAQMLLNTKGYDQSRYVTIEGKRYYRKGLVSRGEKMKSSDRDFSGDLEDIDNS